MIVDAAPDVVLGEEAAGVEEEEEDGADVAVPADAFELEPQPAAKTAVTAIAAIATAADRK